VRAQDIKASNTREIDVGTANNITLRRGGSQDSATQPTPNQGQPRGAVQQPSGQPTASLQPTAGTTPDASVASAPPGSAIISFDPPMLNQAAGSTFTVNVNLTGGQNIYSVPVQILYNPRVLQLLNVSNGPLLSQDGQPVALVNRDDSLAGILQVTASRPPGTSGITGNGQVFTLTFQAKAPGQATLSINRASLKNASMQSVPAGGSQAIVTVH